MKNPALTLLLVILTATISSSYAQTDVARYQLANKPSLTFELAHRMAMACIQRQLKKKSSSVYVSIFDEGANPILLLKMDGAVLGAGVSAMRKAESSARFPYSSNEVSNWIKNNTGVAQIPGILGVQGGLPIIAESGAHLGGIGVSGATATEDESCAKEAIESIQAYL